MAKPIRVRRFNRQKLATAFSGPQTPIQERIEITVTNGLGYVADPGRVLEQIAEKPKRYDTANDYRRHLLRMAQTDRQGKVIPGI